MHAIKFLLNEHNRVRKMLAAIESAASEKTQRSKFETLSVDLLHHEKMEEKIWYPFLKKNTDLASVIERLIAQEKKAATTISALKKITSSEQWMATFLELKGAVEQHAQDEETKLFPKVENKIDAEDLEEIGSRMQQFKKELDAKNA